jgi:hypothetical protein
MPRFAPPPGIGPNGDWVVPGTPIAPGVNRPDDSIVGAWALAGRTGLDAIIEAKAVKTTMPFVRDLAIDPRPSWTSTARFMLCPGRSRQLK